MKNKDYLKIGFIKKPHGLKGELKVLPLTDDPKRFYDLKYIYLAEGDKLVKYPLSYVKKSYGEVLIKLPSCNSREECDPFRSKYIYIERDQGVNLNEWEYYSQDLIDCDVYFNNSKIGTVVDLLNSGANDNLVILCENHKEYLYPFLRLYVDKVDIPQQRIDINQYEGFFD